MLGDRDSINQGCGVGVGVEVTRDLRFLGGIGVGYLRTIGVGVGVGFFCPTPLRIRKSN